jgi:hypothetical protein
LKPKLVVEVGYDSFHRRSLPARNEIVAVAPRQIAASMHAAAIEAAESEHVEATQRNRDADRLKSAHEEKDEQDDNDEPKAAGRIVAPPAAVGPRRKGANENQDQDNQQNGAERHLHLLGLFAKCEEELASRMRDRFEAQRSTLLAFGC